MTDFKHITNCIHCGAPKVEPLGGGAYRCTYCGDVFSADDITGYGMRVQKELAQQVSGAVSEQIIKQRERDIGNARQNLYAEIKAEHINSCNVIGCCRKLKEYLPEDFQANTFEVLNSGSKMQINKCLDSIDEKGEGRYYIKDILDFMLRSLVTANVLSLKSLADRALNGEEKTRYLNAIEEEAEKYNEGMYNPKIPRKAFIAYSSSDMQRVNEIVNYLEDSGISCFVALRNLRHGKGAVENYEKLLKEAMHSCKCFVLISSRNSRRLDCDAMDKELPYVRDYEPQVKRIEYIIDDYGSEGGAKTILKDFFGPSEQCRDKDDLVKRIFNATTQKQANVNGDLQKQIEEYKKQLAEEAERRRKELEEAYKKKEEDLKKKEEAQRREGDRSKRNEISSNTFANDSVNARKDIAIPLKQTSKRSSNVPKNQSHIAVNYTYENETNSLTQQTAITQGQLSNSYPTLKNYDRSEFEIDGTTLKKYNGVKSQVLIPDGVTTIADRAFWFHYSIKSIIIPKSVISITEGAFKDCKLLESITVDRCNAVYHSTGDCIIETAKKRLIVGCKKSIIPNDGSVTSIGDGAFYGCDSLVSITIPDSVISIGRFAFKDCKIAKATIPTCACNYMPKDSLQTVIITSGKRIEWRAFKDFKSLKSITIANSVTSIGESAFEGCAALPSITIPNSVISIGKSAFKGCALLKSITIPGSVKSIEPYVFEGCSNLTSIKMLDGVTSIDIAFKECSRLENIEMPNSITSIEQWCFAGCEALKKIIIPSSVKNIGKFAFLDCPNLKIYCRIKRFHKPKGWCRGWNAKEIDMYWTTLEDFEYYPNNVKFYRHKIIWGYKGK